MHQFDDRVFVVFEEQVVDQWNVAARRKVTETVIFIRKRELPSNRLDANGPRLRIALDLMKRRR